MTSEPFRVDLRGLVEILSHHLYSSPRVYLRELVQNARDAVVARGALDADSPRRIVVRVDEAAGTVVVRDSGIGLDAAEMRELLAMIGATSKASDLVAVRRDFLGRFGIGLLACFLVADDIEVRSRSARIADAPTIRWIGSSDGTYTIDESAEALDEPGSEVRVRARPDERAWTTASRVGRLLDSFAAYLDVPISLESDRAVPRTVSTRTPPWRLDEDRAARHCRAEFGFEPLAVLPLRVEPDGVEGVAFVTPNAVRARVGDTVFCGGMLLAVDNTQLVPDWATFVRVVIECGELAPTASREHLQDGPALRRVRDELGRQIRDHVERLAVTEPIVFDRFARAHDVGLRALALEDDRMLDLVTRFLPCRSSRGLLPLAELVADGRPIAYTLSSRRFDALRETVAASGTILVDADALYEPEIIRRTADATPDAGIEAFDLGRFVDGLPEPVGSDRAVAVDLARLAMDALDDPGTVVDVRVFDPAGTPALFVEGTVGTGDHGERGDEWADLLGLGAAAVHDRLVLNLASSPVRSLVGAPDGSSRAAVVDALLVLGRLQAGAPIMERESERLGRVLASFLAIHSI